MMFKDKLKCFSNYTTPVFDVQIKSDANENLLDFPDRLSNILKDIVVDELCNLKYYPEMNSDSLKTELSKFYNIDKNNIIIGNGSDQLIQIIIQSACEKDDYILALYPSFVMYRITANLLDVNTSLVDISKDWKYDIEKIAENLLKNDRIKVIFFDSPNNPTGMIFKKEDIEVLTLRFPDRLFVIDNAYGEYSDTEYLDMALKYDNVVLLKTFSKIGFAGMRCGYAISNKEVIDTLHKVKPPYNVNNISSRIAIEVLKNFNTIKQNIELIKKERQRMVDLLKEKFLILPSEANFICIVDEKSDEIFDHLLMNSILVKKFNIDGKKLLRITINKPEANDIIIKSLLNFDKGRKGE